MLIWGVNVCGFKYIRFFDEYEYNVIVVVVVIVVFLVFFLGSCGVWKFRYREDEDVKVNMFNMIYEDNGVGLVMYEIFIKIVELFEGNGVYDNLVMDMKL